MAHTFSRMIGAAALATVFVASPATAINLPFGFGGTAERDSAPRSVEAPVQMAQAGDVSLRISQMEAEMRRLTGKVEEMSFLVLQLQEQLRNTQADNELRFQDLEGGSGGGGASEAPERRSEAPAETPATTPASGPGSGDQEFALGLPPADAPAAQNSDEIGELLDTASLDNLGSSIPAQGGPTPPVDNSQTVASITPSGPVEMYSLAYNYLLAGDYQLAERTFRQYADTYPDSEDAPDARYWLGESLFAQNKFRDAAEVFLNAQKSHPESDKAPEMMLKLGMSLARLDNADTACVTYAEVERRYPEISANVKRKLDQEESAANCG